MRKVGHGVFVRAAFDLAKFEGKAEDVNQTPPVLEEREVVRQGVTHRLLAVVRRKGNQGDLAHLLPILDASAITNLGLKSKKIEVKLKPPKKKKASKEDDKNGGEIEKQKKAKRTWAEKCRDFVQEVVFKSNGVVLIEGDPVAAFGAALACLLLIPDLQPKKSAPSADENVSKKNKKEKKKTKKEKKEQKEHNSDTSEHKEKRSRSLRKERKGKGDKITAASDGSTSHMTYEAAVKLFEHRCGQLPVLLPSGIAQVLQSVAAPSGEPSKNGGTSDLNNQDKERLEKYTKLRSSAPTGKQGLPSLSAEQTAVIDKIPLPTTRPRSVCMSKGVLATLQQYQEKESASVYEESTMGKPKDRESSSSGATTSGAPPSLNTSTNNAGASHSVATPTPLRASQNGTLTPRQESSRESVSTPQPSPTVERQRRNVEPVQPGIKEPLAFVRRNRAPNEKPDPSDKIYKLGDLPRELRSIVLGTKIPFDELEKHFDIVLNILYFNKRVELPKRRRVVDRDYRAEPDMEPVALEGPRYAAKTEGELLNTSINPKKAFKFVCMTGQGGYGKVWTAKADIPEIKGKVAVKRLPHTDPKEVKHNLNEMSFLSFCKHPNIVRYYTSCMLKDELLIVMEHMEGGTLTEATKGHNFTELQIAFVARELLKGLAYLHDNRLAHRDLKSANIMMTIKGEIKLIDFGLCVDVSNGPRNDMVGSPFWMAPEMVGRRPHSTPVDIWSFAISLLELANKNPPHRKSSFKCMFTFGTIGCPDPLNEPGKWSEEFRHFLSLCLHIDPAQRATARQLLKHPFVLKTAAQKQMAQLINQIFMQTAISQVVIS